MPDTYRTTDVAVADKAEMERLRRALNASKTSLRRDECSLWTLRGRNGNYISTFGDRASWVIYLQCRSPKAWTYAKRRLEACGCVVTQDGDDEGCLHLTRLPDAAAAAEIRDLVGMRQPGPVTDPGGSRVAELRHEAT